MTPLLEVKKLTKGFPITAGLFRRQVGVFEALKGIDLTVNPQEVAGIVGESGSGKSTLARVILRLIPPSSGSVFFLGENFLEKKGEALKEMRRHIQMVFQDPYSSLNPRKTIEACIGEPLTYWGLAKDQKERREKVAELLLQVGCSPDLMNRFPHQLSGGQQQRITIGRALGLEPKIIVLDEALSSLDVSVQSQILNLLISLKKERNLSYIFISHDLRVVRQICDHVTVLCKGEMVESSNTEELFANPKHPYTRKLLSSIPKEFPWD